MKHKFTVLKKKWLNNFILLGLLCFGIPKVQAQKGIGTDSPSKAAALEIKSQKRGLLIPRVPLESLTNYSPITGAQVNSLLVYNTESSNEMEPGYYYWTTGDGGKWNRIINADDLMGYIADNEVFEAWLNVDDGAPTTDNDIRTYHKAPVYINRDDFILDGEMGLDVGGAIRGGAVPQGTIGENSLAVGQAVEASGKRSIAFGYKSKAVGDGAFAGGNGNNNLIGGTAEGVNSFSFGRGNTSAMNYSVTIGKDNTAEDAEFTIAIGQKLTANKKNETVFGWHNNSDIPNSLFQIGNGDNNNASSALTLLQDASLGIGINETPTAQLDIGNRGNGKVRIRELPNTDGSETDKIVVVDENGILKSRESTASQSMFPKFFYMPAYPMPLNGVIATSQDHASESNGIYTIELYDIYAEQFGLNHLNSASSVEDGSLPVLNADELIYHITYFDGAVFTDVSVNTNGQLTYKILNSAEDASTLTYMNIVFEVK